MESNVVGLALITLGGLASASFYVPFKGVRNWTWETYWVVFGVTAWLIGPWIGAAATVPNLGAVITEAPLKNVLLCYMFGAMWGVGSLTNGLAIRYMGMSLGWAIPLGLCAGLGTLIPPVIENRFGELISNKSGIVTLASVFVGLLGIAICAKAGLSKDRDLAARDPSASREFHLRRGLLLSILSGVMSSCMAFGIYAGKPIADSALAQGAEKIWQNNPIFTVLLLGGFTTNAIWCVLLSRKNRTTAEFTSAGDSSLAANYALCVLAGVLWYLQPVFFGMGTTYLGDYEFAGWSVLMVSIIIFSNLYGLFFREWANTSRSTHAWIFAGIVVLALSMVLTGVGSYLGNQTPASASEAIS